MVAAWFIGSTLTYQQAIYRRSVCRVRKTASDDEGGGDWKGKRDRHIRLCNFMGGRLELLTSWGNENQKSVMFDRSWTAIEWQESYRRAIETGKDRCSRSVCLFADPLDKSGMDLKVFLKVISYLKIEEYQRRITNKSNKLEVKHTTYVLAANWHCKSSSSKLITIIVALLPHWLIVVSRRDGSCTRGDQLKWIYFN